MNRLINLLLVGGIGAAVIASFIYLGIDLGELGDSGNLAQMGAYAQRFLSPDLSAAHLQAIGHGAVETLAMSALGTLLAAVLGLLLALPAAGRFGWTLQNISRLVLNALRAIPELVWAALMVLAAGLGPNAGTLALALHTTGVLGRLFAEALENTRRNRPTPSGCKAVTPCGRSATAPCPISCRNCWPTFCTAGRTTSAWPACWVSSVPAAWVKCSMSASACFRKRKPARSFWRCWYWCLPSIR